LKIAWKLKLGSAGIESGAVSAGAITGRNRMAAQPMQHTKEREDIGTSGGEERRQVSEYRNQAPEGKGR
jgi:hypothetical protein